VKEFFSNWSGIRRSLTPPKDILWLFDFDGTLAPIVKHPDGAVMRSAMRLLLQKLAGRYPGRVGILSGRPIKHLRRKVGIKKLIYGGTQGFEIKGEGYSWTYPFPRRRKEQFHLWIQDLRRGIKDIPGLWIEEKGWTFCIHFRQVRIHNKHRLRSFLRKTCNQAKAFGFKSQAGLKALEFYSDARWNKGRATLWLKERCHAAKVFYVGDDITDETVFRALRRSGVNVRVRLSRISRAQYYLKQQPESEKMLKRILTL